MILFLGLLGIAILGCLGSWWSREAIRARQSRVRRAAPRPWPGRLRLRRLAGPRAHRARGPSVVTLARFLDQVLKRDPWLVEAWILENLADLDRGSLEQLRACLARDPARSPALMAAVLGPCGPGTSPPRTGTAAGPRLAGWASRRQPRPCLGARGHPAPSPGTVPPPRGEAP